MELLMALKDHGIEYVEMKNELIASWRVNPKNRSELVSLKNEFIRTIPEAIVSGYPFSIFRYVSSIQEGYDVELCMPITEEFFEGEITTRVLPPLSVLRLVHNGASDELPQTYRSLYSTAYEHGLISDEFGIEVYPDDETNTGNIELLFVVHDWGALLEKNTERVLGTAAATQILLGRENLSTESMVDERYQWVKNMLQRMEKFADERQTYDILSSCSHRFPEEPIQRIHEVYRAARGRGGDNLDAVDSIIEYMGSDPAWGEQPYREGYTIFASKGPYNRNAYDNAKTDAERRRAACFCPVIRNNLDGGMPPAYCNCGAGWYQRQWEGVFEKPVFIEVVKSVLNGDDHCEFAIHIPKEL